MYNLYIVIKFYYSLLFLLRNCDIKIIFLCIMYVVEIYLYYYLIIILKFGVVCYIKII